VGNTFGFNNYEGVDTTDVENWFIKGEDLVRRVPRKKA